MRRVIIILILIAVLIFLGYLAFRSFRSPAGPEEGIDAFPPDEGAAARIILPAALSSEPAFDYWLKPATGEIYYLSLQGRIYRLAASGEEEKISDQPIQDLNELRSSFDGQLIALSFGPIHGEKFSVFDTSSLSWQPLPDRTRTAAWSPTKSQLAYLIESDPRSTLAVFDFDTQKTAEFIKLSERGLGLDWATSSEIYLTQKPSFKTPGSLWSLALETKTLRSILKEEFGLMVNWSADSELGLKFSNRLRENELKLIDPDGRVLKNAPFLTLPPKCFLEERFVYCAVPREIPAGTILPDDYLKRQVYFDDRIISWDTESGEVKTIFDDSNLVLDIEGPTKTENKLFFINRYDRKLYSIAIGD